jgi:2-dehydro-3-deoxyphosphogluconate aldolase/(4S)-4-hydroxy-2-oxoglutarate aldolase
MSYPGAAWERAMRVQEILLKALSGEIHWFRAADIVGMQSPESATLAGAVRAVRAVVTELRHRMPDLIVGADSSWDLESARRAVDAGAMFVTSPGLDSRSILEFVIQEDMVVIPGALTPSELSTAWQAGADFVKVFPCHSMGGPRYIQSLRGPFPAIPMIASGGVNQVNAGEFIASGAAALGIGTELIPKEAVESRNGGWIRELARRFLLIVKDARAPIPRHEHSL